MIVVTDAVVLHSATYLESSRILRLATREAGVQSVVARGARSSKKRFGSGVDLFAQGQAQIDIRPGRDLHTLTGFDVTVSRADLASDLDRFLAANAIAECVLRLVHDEAAPAVYERLLAGLERLQRAAPGDIVAAAVGALWQVVAEVGYRPAIDQCAECHAPLDPAQELRFNHHTGGSLCGDCVRIAPGGRLLPEAARSAIRSWLSGEAVQLEERAARAHQRLLREFLIHQLADARPLKAYQVWEQARW
jgi:DNA repair protein RecO (recombination protein O)